MSTRGRRRLRVGASALTAAGALALGGALGVSPALAEPDLCVAANGKVRVQKGSATCSADGLASVAVVHGAMSEARVTAGTRNRALIIGDEGLALAWHGDNNTATLIGDGSVAVARVGNNNTATVIGDGGTAIAFNGNNNTATAGDNCTADARDGDGITATCP